MLNIIIKLRAEIQIYTIVSKYIFVRKDLGRGTPNSSREAGNKPDLEK